MNTLSAIVVDDEPLVRQALGTMLQADPEIELVASCDGRCAAGLIREHRPDVVFMDVQMPYLDGFEVLEELDGSERPEVIFLSTGPEQAARAFDVSAVDYLLKPIDEARLGTAIRRAKTAIRHHREGYLADQVERLLHYAREWEGKESNGGRDARLESTAHLVLKGRGALHFLKTSDVIWIEAQGDLVKVQTSTKMQHARETLQSLEQKLDAAKFLRIHRSFLVNLDHVVRVEPALYGDYAVFMSDGAKLRLSRSYRPKLNALIDRPVAGSLNHSQRER
ncbi:MAG TPA: LytTR family DNA-binding domain-containing protein [Opitutus sp.]|nr:LytTR family DNA-binding domain-containing protein [Opitutus sp.]